MNKNKIMIAVLVLFILIVAVIALVAKYQVESGVAVKEEEKSAVSDKSNIVASNQSITPVSTASDNTIVTVDNPIQVTGPSLNALPDSAEAPKQEVVNANKIPAQAIKIDMSASGFSPKEFRVKAGAEVVLALSASDGNTHVFIFPNASLMGLQTMVLGGETKTLTFNAPIAGSYAFRDDLPAYRANTGVMIVE